MCELAFFSFIRHFILQMIEPNYPAYNVFPPSTAKYIHTKSNISNYLTEGFEETYPLYASGLLVCTASLVFCSFATRKHYADVICLHIIWSRIMELRSWSIHISLNDWPVDQYNITYNIKMQYLLYSCTRFGLLQQLRWTNVPDRQWSQYPKITCAIRKMWAIINLIL